MQKTWTSSIATTSQDGAPSNHSLHPLWHDASCSSSFTEEDSFAIENVRRPLLGSAPDQAPISKKRSCLSVRRQTPLLLATFIAVAFAVSVAAVCSIFRVQKPSLVLSMVPSSTVDLSNFTVSALNAEGWKEFDTTTTSPHRAPVELRMLDAQTSFSQECADLWISQGEICDALQRNPLQDGPIDAVWTWVVETDYWTAWKSHLQGNVKETKKKKSAGLFRSHHQLRFSIRSALEALPSLRKIHLLTSDLPVCSNITCDVSNASRVGQSPNWLASNVPQNRLQVQHHWNLFRSDVRNASAWRNTTLPVFNSLAIESQLSNVADLAETFLYFNDDSYITSHLSSSDIATPLFGPVFRMQRNLLVTGEAPGTSRHKATGEWPSLTYANWLLDRRFGERGRPYLAHQAKTLVRPLLEEATSTWSIEFDESAGVRFRGQGNDLNTLFLATHYVLEKHREALLWSYFVARMDTAGTGRYSLQDRERIVAEFAKAPNAILLNGTDLRVYSPNRISPTFENADHLLRGAGLSRPEATTYQFSSADGYALVPIGQLVSGWPTYSGIASSGKPHARTMSLEKCFDGVDFATHAYSGNTSSVALFKRMAFEQPDCGDLAIAVLLGRSGSKGLEAFLPSTSDKLGIEMEAAPPLLGGRAKTWEAADFSLDNAVQGKWTARDYAVRLLQRYSYIIGDTKSLLILMRSPMQTLNELKALEAAIKSGTGPALATLNDDIIRLRDVPTVDASLASWHAHLWPNRTEFERIESVFMDKQ